MAISTSKAWGLPYQGSKRRIAKQIVDALPSAPILVDAFAGGCAVTHAALTSVKFDQVVANDLSDYPTLFQFTASGKKPSYAWVSREEFFKRKELDPVVKYCWSFKNDGKSYLYSKEIEPLKFALHQAVINLDTSYLPDDLRASVAQAIDGLSTWKARYLSVKKVMRLQQMEHLERLQHLERMQQMEHLERLQHLERMQHLERLERLVVTRRDYRSLRIPSNAVVYCDPPYIGTTGYSTAFDRREFYSWARFISKTNLVFVSEYWMPPDFKCVGEFEVRALAGGGKSASQTRVEKLFTI